MESAGPRAASYLSSGLKSSGRFTTRTSTSWSISTMASRTAPSNRSGGWADHDRRPHDTNPAVDAHRRRGGLARPGAGPRRPLAPHASGAAPLLRVAVPVAWLRSVEPTDGLHRIFRERPGDGAVREEADPLHAEGGDGAVAGDPRRLDREGRGRVEGRREDLLGPRLGTDGERPDGRGNRRRRGGRARRHGGGACSDAGANGE